RMLGAVARYFPPGTLATRPQGGFFVWVEMPAPADSLALHRRALARSIRLAPGPMFSASGQFAHALRLKDGRPWEDRVESAIRELDALAGRRRAAAPRAGAPR